MLNLKQWITKKANIAKRTAGLEEKKTAVKRKMEVAMSILDRRQEDRREEERRHEDLPVELERREYHEKLA